MTNTRWAVLPWGYLDVFFIHAGGVSYDGDLIVILTHIHSERRGMIADILQIIIAIIPYLLVEWRRTTSDQLVRTTKMTFCMESMEHIHEHLRNVVNCFQAEVTARAKYQDWSTQGRALGDQDLVTGRCKLTPESRDRPELFGSVGSTEVNLLSKVLPTDRDYLPLQRVLESVSCQRDSARLRTHPRYCAGGCLHAQIRASYPLYKIQTCAMVSWGLFCCNW